MEIDLIRRAQFISDSLPQDQPFLLQETPIDLPIELYNLLVGIKKESGPALVPSPKGIDSRG
jgi:hypothetical protein